MLDGPAPSLIALPPRHIARDANAAFTRLNQYCQSDPLCQQHYGDLTRNAEHIRQHLQTADEANTPEHIGLPDPLNQKSPKYGYLPLVASLNY